MNRFKFIIVTLALFASFSVIEEAGATIPKVDAPNTGGGFFQTVSNIIDDAHEQLKEAEKWVNEKVLGPAQAELKSFRDSVEGDLADMKKDYEEGVGADINKAKDDATKAVSDAKNTAKDAVGGVAGDAAGAVTGLVGDDVNIGNLKGVNQEDVQELSNLSIQKTKIETKYKIEITAKEQYYDTLISALTKSMSEAQEKLSVPGVTDNDTLKYQSTIRTLNEQKSKLETEKSTEIFAINKAKETELREVDAKIAELKLKITKDLKEKATKAAQEKGKKYFGKQDVEEGLKEAEKAGFIGENEKENEETVTRTVKSRRKMAIDEIMNSIVVGTYARTILVQSNDKVEKMVEQGKALEGLSANVLMDMNIKIEELRALIEYNKVLLAEMKLKTSNSLVRIDKYKIEEKHKDVTRFSLDDYDFGNQCKLVGSK